MSKIKPDFHDEIISRYDIKITYTSAIPPYSDFTDLVKVKSGALPSRAMFIVFQIFAPVFHTNSFALCNRKKIPVRHMLSPSVKFPCHPVTHLLKSVGPLKQPFTHTSSCPQIVLSKTSFHKSYKKRFQQSQLPCVISKKYLHFSVRPRT